MDQVDNQKEDLSRAYIIDVDRAIRQLYELQSLGEDAALVVLIDLNTMKFPEELYKQC